ncbi:MAG TPA: hypothetical protein VLH77_02235 [Gammaproteobacteria bacterium]|nr:hypothetical protein [Gammaproteobacteria bacterium]
MKKSKMLALSALTSAALASSVVFANEFEDGKATCERWVKDYNDVHCVYATGLDNSYYSGRYVKYYNSKEDFSYTRCLTNDSVEDDISQDMAEYSVGNQTVEYSICTNAKAEQCEPVAVDTYNIAKNGDTYVGTPTTYAIDLSAVKDKYPACNGLHWGVKQGVKLSFKGEKR